MPTVRNHGLSSWTYRVGRQRLRRSDECLRRGQQRLFPHSDILCRQNPKSFKWKHILSVSFRGSGRRKERPWQNYCVCETSKTRRERPARNGFGTTCETESSHFSSLTPHSRFKMCFGPCFRGGPNNQPLLLTKTPTHQPGPLSYGSARRLPHSNAQAGRKSCSHFNGGRHVCLDNFPQLKHPTLTTHRTQTSDNVHSFSTPPPAGNNKTRQENKATPKDMVGVVPTGWERKLRETGKPSKVLLSKAV